MSFPNGSSKPSDTASYTGDAPAYQQTSGTQQVGGWAVGNAYFAFSQEITEGVPAASFVTISGQDGRLKQVGTRQQLSLIISLAADAAGYTLRPSLTDAQGNATTPVGSYFSGISRQKFVCTFANGKIVPVGIGSCDVEVTYPQAQVNANFSTNGLNVSGSGGATSNPSNFISATINLVVTR